MAKINRVGWGPYCTSRPVTIAPSPNPNVGATLLTSEPS
jgi:hypothetical protein